MIETVTVRTGCNSCLLTFCRKSWLGPRLGLEILAQEWLAREGRLRSDCSLVRDVKKMETVGILHLPGVGPVWGWRLGWLPGLALGLDCYFEMTFTTSICVFY